MMIIPLIFAAMMSCVLVLLGAFLMWPEIEKLFIKKKESPAPSSISFDSTIVAPASVPVPPSTTLESPSKKKKPDVTPPKKPDVTPPKKPDVTPPKKPDATPPKKPDVMPQKKPDMTPIVASSVLEFHNQVRARHGAGPLTWSPTVAASAQAWASSCNTNHGSATGANYGQNLAWGVIADEVAAAQLWYREYQDIQNAGYDMTKGGHFTQMAWKTVKEMGCGKAMCPLPGWNGTLGPYYVCEYNPPGNVAWPGDEQRSYKEHVQVDPS